MRVFFVPFFLTMLCLLSPRAYPVEGPKCVASEAKLGAPGPLIGWMTVGQRPHPYLTHRGLTELSHADRAIVERALRIGRYPTDLNHLGDFIQREKNSPESRRALLVAPNAAETLAEEPNDDVAIQKLKVALTQKLTKEEAYEPGTKLDAKSTRVLLDDWFVEGQLNAKGIRNIEGVEVLGMKVIDGRSPAFVAVRAKVRGNRQRLFILFSDGERMQAFVPSGSDEASMRESIGAHFAQFGLVSR